MDVSTGKRKHDEFLSEDNQDNNSSHSPAPIWSFDNKLQWASGGWIHLGGSASKRQKRASTPSGRSNTGSSSTTPKRRSVTPTRARPRYASKSATPLQQSSTTAEESSGPPRDHDSILDDDITRSIIDIAKESLASDPSVNTLHSDLDNRDRLYSPELCGRPDAQERAASFNTNNDYSTSTPPSYTAPQATASRSSKSISAGVDIPKSKLMRKCKKLTADRNFYKTQRDKVTEAYKVQSDFTDHILSRLDYLEGIIQSNNNGDYVVDRDLPAVGKKPNPLTLPLPEPEEDNIPISEVPEDQVTHRALATEALGVYKEPRQSNHGIKELKRWEGPLEGALVSQPTAERFYNHHIKTMNDFYRSVNDVLGTDMTQSENPFSEIREEVPDDSGIEVDPVETDKGKGKENTADDAMYATSDVDAAVDLPFEDPDHDITPTLQMMPDPSGMIPSIGSMNGSFHPNNFGYTTTIHPSLVDNAGGSCSTTNGHIMYSGTTNGFEDYSNMPSAAADAWQQIDPNYSAPSTANINHANSPHYSTVYNYSTMYDPNTYDYADRTPVQAYGGLDTMEDNISPNSTFSSQTTGSQPPAVRNIDGTFHRYAPVQTFPNINSGSVQPLHPVRSGTYFNILEDPESSALLQHITGANDKENYFEGLDMEGPGLYNAGDNAFVDFNNSVNTDDSHNFGAY